MQPLVEITNYYSFWAYLIGFIAALFKATFDVFINPRIFNKEYNEELKNNSDGLESAKRKRNRSDQSTIYAFILIGISYGIKLMEVIK